MRLRELDAQFLVYSREVRPFIHHAGVVENRAVDVHHYVDSLAEAHGIMFLCPKCFAANKGPIGTHSVICWFVGKVPDDVFPKPGRWTPQGAGIDDLTFVPSEGRSCSVLLPGPGCEWHGFVRNGDAS